MDQPVTFDPSRPIYIPIAASTAIVITLRRSSIPRGYHIFLHTVIGDTIMKHWRPDKMPQLCYRVLSTCQENLPAAQLRFAMGRLAKGLLQGMLNSTGRLEMTEAVLASTGDGRVPHVLAELPSRRWAHRMHAGYPATSDSASLSP